MIAFKKRSKAQRLCNYINTFKCFNYMVVEVPSGFIVTKAKGVNSHG